MDGQAFTVLPPLSPRLPPPPPTPAPTRVAPRTVANKETTAFVILGEIKIPRGGGGDDGLLGAGQSGAGRVSPFRGSGFRAPSPPASKIPVKTGKSAPSSPVRSKIVDKTTSDDDKNDENRRNKGKSAPSSPKKTRINSKNVKTPNALKKPSESKIPVNAPTVKEPTTVKRLTAKPPVPKSPRKSSNSHTIPTGKQPQPAKRIVDGKPAPAARARLNNNKPTSTEFKPGSLAKDRLTGSSNVPPRAAARKTLSKPSEADNVEVTAPEDDGQGSETKVDNSATLDNNEATKDNTNDTSKRNTEHGINKAMMINVDEEDILSKVVTVTETVPEIHKLNIEINRDDDDHDDEPNSITVVELITPDEDDLPSHSVKEPNGFLVSDSDDGTSDDVVKIKNGGGGVVRREGGDSVQPDVIPTDDIVEESKETIQGPPEVEVDAGNHTVTFRSPEIHPVSPRVEATNQKSNSVKDRLVGCCWKPQGSTKVAAEMNAANNNKNKDDKLTKGSNRTADDSSAQQKWYSKLCRWKKEPPPPRLSRPMKARGGETILSKLNCCKNKRKGKPLNPYTPLHGQSVWRKMFCLDKAFCAKCCCRKTPPAAQIRPQGTSRLEMKRSSSVPVPTKATGLPKLDGALVEHSSMMKGAIPVLPICLAWMCLILNIILPGSGTIISGFLCVCFGKPRFSVHDSWPSRLGSLCLNFIVGISQAFTILFCLVGWGWSIWWGVIMVKVARKNRRMKMAEKAAAATGHLTSNQNHDVEKGEGADGKRES